ncbi:hypothetical protein G6F60_015183 [Rhizopus arrhizus]|nr:hypothetical protein G6F60_015183 [Rhizopus arrhizus]
MTAIEAPEAAARHRAGAANPAPRPRRRVSRQPGVLLPREAAPGRLATAASTRVRAGRTEPTATNCPGSRSARRTRVAGTRPGAPAPPPGRLSIAAVAPLSSCRRPGTP